MMHTYLTAQGDPRVDRWGVAVAPSARVPALVRRAGGGFIGMLGVLTALVLLIACSVRSLSSE